MDYGELEKLLDNDLVKWVKHILPNRDPEDEYFNMSLQDFLDYLFWAGGANYDDQKWTSVPQQTAIGQMAISNFGPFPVEFTDGTHEYSMKLVTAENDTVMVGEPFWWETRPYRSMNYKPEDWEYATEIEITKQGDSDILRIWQTYGEPHGLWEWDLQKLGNPVAINYLRFK